MSDEPTEKMMNAGYDATRLEDGTPQFAKAGFALGHTRTIYMAMRAAVEPEGDPKKYADMDMDAKAHAMADDGVGDPWELLGYFREKLRQSEVALEDTRAAALRLALRNG
jgi:hypothetical protein